jgi:transketolase
MSHSSDVLAINTIRTLSIDAIQRANSGHPGLPMGAAPMAHVLWNRFLNIDPSAPKWVNRDRFVLSGGHGSMLQYSLLHLAGFDVSMDDIKQFRQWESLTPGHPESHLTPGVEATTGPLGQGASNSVGMAMAERYLAETFNRPGFDIFDHHTYALVTDGDLMEGVVAEAAALAGFLKLGKLIWLYDANEISLDGPASLAFSTDAHVKQLQAHGWHTVDVPDADTNCDAIASAIEEAQNHASQPTMIVMRTTIGYGSPSKAGTSGVHGAPLGDEEITKTKEALGWDHAPFSVPDEVRQSYTTAMERGKKKHQAWNELKTAYEKEFPELSGLLDLALRGELPANAFENLGTWEKPTATRSASGEVIQMLAKHIPWLFGGDADLGGSTKTNLKEGGSFDGKTGRNIHFGVREHAMAAIANGMAYHGVIRPYIATFFCFSDYMRPSVRLAAMNHLPVTYVWTHDSIGVGEDGPTHQPVEHIMALRTIPGLVMLRPADANETRVAWEIAASSQSKPTGLVLTRQNVPVVSSETDAEQVRKGAYVLRDADGAKVTIFATGSEVSLAIETADRLASEGVQARVVSMPSWELFADQDDTYKRGVLGDAQLNVAIEAGVSLGWERWVGRQGLIIGLDRYGASAPGDELMQRFGFSAESIAESITSALA